MKHKGSTVRSLTSHSLKAYGFFAQKDKGKRNNKYVSTNCDFFKEEIVVKVSESKVVFRHVEIDDRCTIHTPTKDKGWFKFGITVDMPLGKYYFDEDESNEDQKVIYFNERV